MNRKRDSGREWKSLDVLFRSWIKTGRPHRGSEGNTEGQLRMLLSLKKKKKDIKKLNCKSFDRFFVISPANSVNPQKGLRQFIFGYQITLTLMGSFDADDWPELGISRGIASKGTGGPRRGGARLLIRDGCGRFAAVRSGATSGGSRMLPDGAADGLLVVATLAVCKLTLLPNNCTIPDIISWTDPPLPPELSRPGSVFRSLFNKDVPLSVIENYDLCY